MKKKLFDVSVDVLLHEGRREPALVERHCKVDAYDSHAAINIAMDMYRGAGYHVVGGGTRMGGCKECEAMSG